MVFSSVPRVPPVGNSPAPSIKHERDSGLADDIDFEIKGAEMQFVEIELDPGESAVAEAGSMMFKDPDIEMTTVFGDGSNQEGGFFDKLVGAGKRLITGETLFTTVFTHNGPGKARAGFAAPYPGHVIAVKLDQIGGRLVCQKDAFLCAARGVQLSVAFQKRILTGLFGGEGFVMQSLVGDGWVFVHVGGTIMERKLDVGEELHIDTGCVAAFTGEIEMDVVRAGSIKSMIFGGEGVFFAKLTGPGRVWIQSLPFSRLAGRMLAAAPQGGGRRRGEGSVLGTLGDIVSGDRS